MSQRENKLTWCPAWLKDAVVVKVDCSGQIPEEIGGARITTMENRALAFLKDFGEHLPERGSVTIAWEREKTSPETLGESNS